MSYFSTTLNRLMKGRTQAEISKASGLPRSSIANYAIENSGITVTALAQLLGAFPDEQDRLDLVRAHLRDEIPAEVFDQITIATRCDSLAEDRPQPPAPPWRKDIDRAIDMLRERAETDPDVRQLILDLERVL